MKLIADSGSTKTDWRLIDGGKIVEEIQSSGINPFFQDEKEIRATIEPFYEKLKTYPVQHVFFYGAGCSFEDKKLTLKHTLSYFFPMANIEIQSDMLGVARALLGKGAGIACILGTGSNSCFYDGNEITKNVSSLGFMLGDEGSGATLGRLFISDLLKNQLPENLKNRFFETTKTTPEEIMENVYRKPFPNRYLAQFTRFIAEHIDEPMMYDLVFNAFIGFITRNVMQYDYKSYPVYFTGSVAWYFADVLRDACLASGILPADIQQSPMDGLIHFHQ